MGGVVFLQSRRSPARSSAVLRLFQDRTSAHLRRDGQNAVRERIAAEMREIVRVAGEDGGPIVKGRIALASRRLGLSFAKTYRLWYGQPCDVLAYEADAMRAAFGKILAERARRLEHEIEVIRLRLGRAKEDAA